MSYDGEERRHWHLDKRLSIGHLVTTVSVAIGVILFFADVDKRVDQNTSEIAHTRELMRVEQQNLRQKVDEIDDTVKGVDRKLDKLIERQLEGRSRE